MKPFFIVAILLWGALMCLGMARQMDRAAQLKAARAEAAQSDALARDWQTRCEEWRSIALTLKAPGADRTSRPSVQNPSVP